jgi:hypothetical protein
MMYSAGNAWMGGFASQHSQHKQSEAHQQQYVAGTATAITRDIHTGAAASGSRVIAVALRAAAAVAAGSNKRIREGKADQKPNSLKQ